MVHQGRVLGNIAIVMPTGKALPEPDIIELYARQVSATIRRQELEVSLQSSEERYRSIVIGIRDPLFIVDRDGRCQEVNPAASSLLGYSREELLEMTVSDILAEGHKDELERFEEVKREGWFFGEVHLGTREGGCITAELNATSIGDNHYLATVRDISERRRFEDALVESEERFRTLFHQAQDVVLLHEVSSDGTPGKFVEVNETACKKLGYSRDQLLQLTPFEITAWANPEKVRRSLQRFKEQGSIKDEMTVVAMDGRWIPFEINSHVIQLGGKRLALAVCRDISRRKQMEEALRQSEERYRLLVDMSPDAIAIESEGQLVFANKAAAEMAGVDNPEDLLGQSFLDFIHPADRDRAQARIQALLQGADLPAVEYTLVNSGGELVKAEISSSCLTIAERPALMAIIRDITQRKRAEQALKESEERYRKLVEHSPDAIIVHVDGHCVFANPAAAELAGFSSPDDLIGRDILSAVHPEFTETVLHRIGEVLETGKPAPIIEEKLVRLDGSVIEAEVTAIPFTFDGTEAVQVIARDISERKRLEEEFMQAVKIETVSLLAGGIAHDFNNLLTIILGNVSLARIHWEREGAMSERIIGKITDIEQGVLQARELTQQLSALARGNQPVKELVDLASTIPDTAGLALSGSSCVGQFRIQEGAWLVEADGSQIRQVISNLLINADQAMPNGGTICISLENHEVWEGDTSSSPTLEPGPYVKLSVTDQGHGIAPADLARVFDPYFTTKPGGTGLGLATALSIVRKHGGHIAVESAVDQGTTFIVYLPAAPCRTMVVREEPEPFLAGRGRILVMDDNPAVLEVTAEMLSQLGYEGTYCGDGAEAVRAYRAAMNEGTPYDGLILDLTVSGGMGAIATLAELKGIDPGVRAVVTSGYSGESAITDFESQGFVAFIAKPYRAEDLALALGKALRDG